MGCTRTAGTHGDSPRVRALEQQAATLEAFLGVSEQLLYQLVQVLLCIGGRLSALSSEAVVDRTSVT